MDLTASQIGSKLIASNPRGTRLLIYRWTGKDQPATAENVAKAYEMGGEPFLMELYKLLDTRSNFDGTPPSEDKTKKKKSLWDNFKDLWGNVVTVVNTVDEGTKAIDTLTTDQAAIQAQQKAQEEKDRKNKNIFLFAGAGIIVLLIIIIILKR